jgi:hypothetical protein
MHLAVLKFGCLYPLHYFMGDLRICVNHNVTIHNVSALRLTSCELERHVQAVLALSEEYVL